MARRRLGSELRRLRLAVGRKVEDAAAALDCSTAKISRLETGKGVPYPRDVRDLAAFYDATDRLDELLSLADEGRAQDWISNFRDVFQGEVFVDALAPDNAGRFVYLERDAAVIKSFEAEFIPGLLQRAEYIDAVCALLFPEHKDHERVRFTEFRLARQNALFRRPDPPEFSVVLSESAVLRRIGGSAVMRRQLRFLIDELQGSLAFVDFRILPLTVSVRGALSGPFSIMKFDDVRDQDIVHLEFREGAKYLESDDEVRRYEQLFAEMEEASLTRDKSIRRLAREIATLR